MKRFVCVFVSLCASACATSHAARGLVLKIDAESAVVTVSHEPILGYMPSMVMPFEARSRAELRDLHPGDVIEFRLREREGRSVIDRIRPVSGAAADTGLTMTPAVSSLVKPGETMPDFTLVDQRGASVTLQSLRGRVVAANFIYSRCPLPDYCPRMVSNFSEVRDRFKDRLSKDLVLLTITFDPKYDTPEVLENFAERYRANVPGWHFLTGPPEAIAAVCAAFGIEYWPDQGLITHTLQTAVIDRDGKLAASVEGRSFTGRQIADLVGTILDPS